MRVISLDFWGTIAVFNPEYSQARTKLLAGVFGVDEAEADRRYKKLKHSLDHKASLTGEATTPVRAMRALLDEYFVPLRGAVDFDVAQLVGDLERLAMKHPPIISRHMFGAIADLRHDGFIVGLASNTNFIRGQLILNIYSDLDALLNFAVHSDELGVSKPHIDFFNTVIDRARYQARDRVPKSEMLHIGDHQQCDIAGAERAGMMARLTHSPEETITILSSLPDITKNVA